MVPDRGVAQLFDAIARGCDAYSSPACAPSLDVSHATSSRRKRRRSPEGSARFEDCTGRTCPVCHAGGDGSALRPPAPGATREELLQAAEALGAAIAALSTPRDLSSRVAVAVHLGPSVALVAAVLGVLAAPAVLVPIDPAWPPERQAWALRRTRPVAVVHLDARPSAPAAPGLPSCLVANFDSSPGTAPRRLLASRTVPIAAALPPLWLTALSWDERHDSSQPSIAMTHDASESTLRRDGTGAHARVGGTGDGIAGTTPTGTVAVYLTSGSTGHPRAVCLTEEAVLARLRWGASIDPCVQGAVPDPPVRLLRTPPGFVDSLAEILTPVFLRQSAVALCDTSGRAVADPLATAACLVAHSVTHATLVPWHLSALSTALASPGSPPPLSGLRQVVCSGDLLTTDVARRFASLCGDRTELWNVYGCAEGTADCAAHRIAHAARHDRPLDREQPSDTVVPVGKSLPGFSILLLRPASGAVGERLFANVVAGAREAPGQVLILGDGVASYLDAPGSPVKELHLLSASDASAAAQVGASNPGAVGAALDAKVDKTDWISPGFYRVRLPGEPQATHRGYVTGDLGIWGRESTQSEGQQELELTVLGRCDDVIKVRGTTVSLTDVEGQAAIAMGGDDVEASASREVQLGWKATEAIQCVAVGLSGAAQGPVLGVGDGDAMGGQMGAGREVSRPQAGAGGDRQAGSRSAGLGCVGVAVAVHMGAAGEGGAPAGQFALIDASGEPWAEALAARVAARVPAAGAPLVVMRVEGALPVGPSGKVDRRTVRAMLTTAAQGALGRPVGASETRQNASDARPAAKVNDSQGPSAARPGVTRRVPLGEAEALAVFAQATGFARMEPITDLFSAGADSTTVTRVAAILGIPEALVLAHPTARALARAATALVSGATSAAGDTAAATLLDSARDAPATPAPDLSAMSRVAPAQRSWRVPLRDCVDTTPTALCLDCLAEVRVGETHGACMCDPPGKHAGIGVIMGSHGGDVALICAHGGCTAVDDGGGCREPGNRGHLAGAFAGTRYPPGSVIWRRNVGERVLARTCVVRLAGPEGKAGRPEALVAAVTHGGVLHLFDAATGRTHSSSRVAEGVGTAPVALCKTGTHHPGAVPSKLLLVGSFRGDMALFKVREDSGAVRRLHGVDLGEGVACVPAAVPADQAGTVVAVLRTLRGAAVGLQLDDSDPGKPALAVAWTAQGLFAEPVFATPVLVPIAADPGSGTAARTLAVFCGVEGAAAAVDASTGTAIWRTTAPSVHGKVFARLAALPPPLPPLVLVLTAIGRLLAIDAATGNILAVAAHPLDPSPATADAPTVTSGPDGPVLAPDHNTSPALPATMSRELALVVSERHDSGGAGPELGSGSALVGVTFEAGLLALYRVSVEGGGYMPSSVVRGAEVLGREGQGAVANGDGIDGEGIGDAIMQQVSGIMTDRPGGRQQIWAVHASCVSCVRLPSESASGLCVTSGGGNGGRAELGEAGAVGRGTRGVRVEGVVGTRADEVLGITLHVE